MEWISIKERLPELSGRYLTFEMKGPHSHKAILFNYPIKCCDCNIAYFEQFSQKWEWSTESTGKCNPTHWMPLPGAPNE